MTKTQQEAYADACNQIEYLTWIVQEERKMIDEMSALLLQAASALEDKKWKQFSDADLQLVIEMRRVAE